MERIISTIFGLVVGHMMACTYFFWHWLLTGRLGWF